MKDSCTRNVKFAAYLRMKALYPTCVNKLGRGKAVYLYSEDKILPAQWELLKTEFDQSEFITYAQNLDAILDLAY